MYMYISGAEICPYGGFMGSGLRVRGLTLNPCPQTSARACTRHRFCTYALSPTSALHSPPYSAGEQP